MYLYVLNLFLVHTDSFDFFMVFYVLSTRSNTCLKS
nr:MAG TPA: hypothetical protein [Bacteriophage sp.]